MKTPPVVFAALLLSISVPVSGYENLSPRLTLTGTSLKYDAMLKSLFAEAYGPDVRARVMASPSNDPEYIIAIKETGGVYRIFRLDVPVQLWGYVMADMLKNGEVRNAAGPDAAAKDTAQLLSRLPADPKTVALKRCQADVDAPLGDRIVDVWKGMLSRTGLVGPGEPVILSLDGTGFSFSMPAGDHELTGDAVGTVPGTPSAMLEGIASTMSELCRSNDRNLTARLGREVGDLLQLLQ